MKEMQILNDFIDEVPFNLKGEEKKLFMAIMKIADDNDELRDSIRNLEEYKPTTLPLYEVNSSRISMDLDYWNELQDFLKEVYNLIKHVD